MSVSHCCISQGSVATYLKCGGNYCTQFVGNFFLFTAVQEFLKSVKIWQSYRQSSGPQFFLGHGVYIYQRCALYFFSLSLYCFRIALQHARADCRLVMSCVSSASVVFPRQSAAVAHWCGAELPRPTRKSHFLFADDWRSYWREQTSTNMRTDRQSTFHDSYILCSIHDPALTADSRSARWIA